MSSPTPTPGRTLVLVSGATGGVGSSVTAVARTRAIRVVPLSSRMGDADGLRSELAERVAADAMMAERVSLVHLAGLTSVDQCEADPAAAQRINVEQTEGFVGTVAETVASWSRPLQILFSGTGHVYAPASPPLRIAENAPLSPRSVYARSKLAGEGALRRIADRHDATLVVARVFGVLGVNQREHFLLPGLIRRVVAGPREAIPGLDNVRDYLASEDVARHLLELATSWIDPPGKVLNVCSGEPWSIRQIVDAVIECLQEAGHWDTSLGGLVGGDFAAVRGRPSDASWLVGDPSQLMEAVAGPIREQEIRRVVRAAVAEHFSGCPPRD